MTESGQHRRDAVAVGRARRRGRRPRRGGWVLLTAWAPVVHGHPAYPVLLGPHRARRRSPPCGGARRPRARPGGWRLVGRGVLAGARRRVGRRDGVAAPVRRGAAGAGGDALRRGGHGHRVGDPHRARPQPAAGPRARSGSSSSPAPGSTRAPTPPCCARSREAGHPVVIAKQPLGIAFLALSAFDGARSDQPEVARWVVGGHSLGGTVAVIQADDADADRPPRPSACCSTRRTRRATCAGRSRPPSSRCPAPATAWPPPRRSTPRGRPARRRDVHRHRGWHARAVRRLRPPARRRHRDDQRREARS